MDTLLQPLDTKVDKNTVELVSILVLMDTLLQLISARSGFNPTNPVSILVLMDTLLQPKRISEEIGRNKYSFNPCFNGYTTSTHIFNKILYL